MSEQKKRKTTDERHYEELARRFADEAFFDKEALAYKAVNWNGATYFHDGGRYVELTERELCGMLRRFCMSKGITQNNRVIGNVVPIVETIIYQDRHTYQTMPFYRGADTFPKPANIIAYRNGLLDVGAYLQANNGLLPHTPLWVSTACLPYDFDPSATCPRWEQFIREVFPEQDGQAELLQEWFGYCLTHDTSQQKFMLWTGVGCNGKGTAWEALKGLVGQDNACGFSLYQLVEQFGLAPLVGRLVAYCGEAELKGSHDKNKMLEQLKCITGEDTLHINRKFDPDGMDITLSPRLVIACNELPVIYETTGALSRRLLLLRFNECFQGREDFGLKDKLRAELSGINNWALRGLARLRSNGRFVIPAATQKAVNDYRRDNSPEFAFIQDCVAVSPAVSPGNLAGVETATGEATASKSLVENAYRSWCKDNDRDLDETRWDLFWRSVHNIIPKLRDNKNGRGDNKTYKGIMLKPAQSP
jgi:putative DNA primase/helicase